MYRRKLLKTLAGIVLASQLFSITAFAGDNYITSYAFADIAGAINGTTITVTVPYSTKTTYWNHRVDVSNGATYSAMQIREIDDKHSVGEIIVTSGDGNQRTYTVNINKSDFKGPTYSIEKATKIKTGTANVKLHIDANDANIRNAYIYYYTSKNSKMSKSVQGTGDLEVELTGLREGTKYYYYLSIEADDRTYETSSKNFTTKAKASTGTSTSSSKNTSTSTSTSTNNTTKGTSGTGTDAKQNNTKKNEWSLENGKWYYYGADGYSKTEWFQVGNKWYYAAKGSNELQMNRWSKINDKWYYFDASGVMFENQWVKGANERWYWMGPSGSMVCGQEITVNGVRYITDPTGVVLSNQFVWQNDHWMYNKPNSAGLAVNETFKIGGTQYHADANGYVY